MAANFATVKLSRRLVDEARQEAELLHRSLAGQIEHWAKLGRALENAKGFSIDRVRATLAGELTIEDLGEAEQDAFFADMGSQFEQPSRELKAAYAELGKARQAARASRLRSAQAQDGSNSAV